MISINLEQYENLAPDMLIKLVLKFNYTVETRPWSARPDKTSRLKKIIPFVNNRSRIRLPRVV